MSGSRWVITPSWLSGSWRSFLYSYSVYFCHLFLICCLCFYLLKEVAIIFITFTIVWSQFKQRGGNKPPPPTDNWIKDLLSMAHCWVFQICWRIEYSIFTASSFRIWNSSIGIPSRLALCVVMFPKAHLIWSPNRGYLGHEDLFCIILVSILTTSS